MTTSKEDYLVAIYRLTQHTPRVSNKALTQELGVSAPSVSEMLATLQKEGQVVVVPYRGSELTASGREKAVEILRSHRIWEVFLTQRLGYTWSQAHELAHELEHVSGTDLADRLDAYLGHPLCCPHGSPIPGKEEVQPPLRLLAQLTVGDRTLIRRVAEERNILNQIEESGLEIGMAVEVVDVVDSKEIMVLQSSDKTVELSLESTRYIYVD